MTTGMTAATWRKSSYSGANNDCVEAGNLPGAVAVRDTKDPDGPALAFTPANWAVFTAAVKTAMPD